MRLCARRSLTADEQDRLRDICVNWGDAEWHALQVAAETQGMAPLVFTHVAQAGLLPVIPPAAAEGLLSAYRTSWLHNRRLRGEQAAIIAALATRGIEVMVVKGVALAARYYDELALRPVGDIDLLVRRADAEACGLTLREMGYLPMLGTGNPRSFIALLYRTLVYRKEPGLVVEVHWELSSLPLYLPCFTVDDLWRRAERIGVSGHVVRYLAVEDELRYLSFHYAAQHRGSRLIWLVDIAGLVRSLQPNWDWSRFVRATVAQDLATPVAVALGHAQRVLGLELPERVLAELQQAALRRRERRAWISTHVSLNRIDMMVRSVMSQPGPAERIALLGAALARARGRWARGLRAPAAMRRPSPGPLRNGASRPTTRRGRPAPDTAGARR